MVTFKIAGRLRIDLPRNWQVKTWQERVDAAAGADAIVREAVPGSRAYSHETLFAASRVDEQGTYLARIHISDSPGETKGQDYARSNPSRVGQRLDGLYRQAASLVSEASGTVTTNWRGTSWREIESGQLVYVTEREAMAGALRVVEWIVTFYGGPGKSFAMFPGYNKDKESLFRHIASIPLNSLYVFG